MGLRVSGKYLPGGKVPGLRGIERMIRSRLLELGEVKEFKIEGRTYEVVVGLYTTPKIKEILKRASIAYHPEHEKVVYGFGGYGGVVVVRLNRIDALKAIVAINRETGLGVRLLNLDESYVIARQDGFSLLSGGITQFLIDGHPEYARDRCWRSAEYPRQISLVPTDDIPPGGGIVLCRLRDEQLTLNFPNR